MVYKEKLTFFNNKRVICLAQTPFQLIGLVSLFSNEVNQDFLQCDMIVLNQFPDAQVLAKKIDEAKIFSSIECLDPVHWSTVHQGHRYLFDALTRPRFNEKQFRARSSLFTLDSYDILICSSATRPALEMKRYLLPDGETFFIDDGSGSHDGAVFRSFGCLDDAPFCKIDFEFGVSGIKAMIKRLACCLVGRKGRLNITKVFLFHPSREDYERLGVMRLEEIPPDALKGCGAVFGGKWSELREKPFDAVYLTLPDDAPQIMRDVERQAIEAISRYEPNLVVRLHPRSSNTMLKEIAGDATTWECEPWEMLLAKGAVSSQTRLYGMGSTAQMHPKIFFDIEPTVVFLHRLLPDGGLRQSIDAAYMTLKGSYGSSEKVIAPKKIGDCHMEWIR